MKVHAFEEFPTTQTLLPAQHLGKGSIVFLGAETLEAFENARTRLRLANPEVVAGWWPRPQDSIWISAFSRQEDLLRMRADVQRTDAPILVDLELPLLCKRTVLRNLPHLRENRRIIRSVLSALGKRAYTAEYPPTPLLPRWLRRWAGISHPGSHTRIVMWYESIIPRWRRQAMRRRLAQQLSSDEGTWVGVGVTATGALGNEPVIPPQQLRENIAWCASQGVENVVVFRLGGIDERYAAALSTRGTNEKP